MPIGQAKGETSMLTFAFVAALCLAHIVFGVAIWQVAKTFNTDDKANYVVGVCWPLFLPIMVVFCVVRIFARIGDRIGNRLRERLANRALRSQKLYRILIPHGAVINPKDYRRLMPLIRRYEETLPVMERE